MSPDDTIDIPTTVTIKKPRWPNFVLLVEAGKDAKIDVGRLTREQVDLLCESFRMHCHNRKEPA